MWLEGFCICVPVVSMDHKNLLTIIHLHLECAVRRSALEEHLDVATGTEPKGPDVMGVSQFCWMTLLLRGAAQVAICYPEQI